MTDNYTARWNLQMMEKYPNWYDHIDKVEAAIQEQDRIISIRQAAGWELDEGGWMAPDPENNDNLIPENEWLDYGLLPPEETCDSQEKAAPRATPWSWTPSFKKRSLSHSTQSNPSRTG